MFKKKIILISLIVFMFCLNYRIFNTNKYVQSDVNEENIIAAYIDGVYSSTLPKKNEGYEVEKVSCTPDVDVSWDSENWGLIFSGGSSNTKCNVYFKFKTIQEYDYTNNEQSLVIPKTGLYKLEVWGGQGGNSIADNVKKETGSMGGYSVGNVTLNKGDIIYINVGGKGARGFLSVYDIAGGYNGGGISHWDKKDDEASGGGGGATHIAKVSGLLSTLENNQNDILIVAAGGGGGSWTNTGGAGGGITGNSAKDRDGKVITGGTQTSGYKFGLGGDGANNTGAPGGGGGGGYYGGLGGSTNTAPGSGGSGYIGNSLLSDKAMYCYNCTASTDTDTKTTSTTCSEETPTENCAKKGNGYAKITLLS